MFSVAMRYTHDAALLAMLRLRRRRWPAGWRQHCATQTMAGMPLDRSDTAEPRKQIAEQLEF